MSVVATADDRRGKPLPNALEELAALVRDDLESVNRLIVEQMHSPVGLIPQLAGHIIAAGGKRLRPMLVLAAARMCGYRGDRQLGLAATVEFIHTATLLHDDVVDESALRRGLATANAVYGNSASVLVGDFLFARAFELMVADGSLDVLRILSHASAVIAEGEVMQLSTVSNPETTEDTYLDVIRSKTAQLFAAACHVGAVVAERPETECAALESYGLNIGMSFQLIDDVLDYSALQATLGKTVGDDFREGKITLPVVLAYRRGTDDERAFWMRTLQRLEQDEGDLQRALALINRHRALEDSIGRARHYGEKARDALAIFPDNREKRALTAIVDFCIDRAY